MSVPIEPNPIDVPAAQWNYVDVQVRDGQRVLRPTHVAFDRLLFSEPPNFLSQQQVEIIVTNNGQSHSSRAIILPHESGSRCVPIQIINAEQKAPAKLIA